MKDKILKLITDYQVKLIYYLHNGEFKDSLKPNLVKQLKVANLAKTLIEYEEEIEEFEFKYFNGQVFVGRYFSDWGLDWVVWYYYEISYYILKFHCNSKFIDSSVESGLREYEPFKWSMKFLD